MIRRNRYNNIKMFIVNLVEGVAFLRLGLSYKNINTLFWVFRINTLKAFPHELLYWGRPPEIFIKQLILVSGFREFDGNHT